MRKTTPKMKMILIPSLALALVVAVSAQPPSNRPKSPKDVLLEFVKMELQGNRLTPEGWRKTAQSLVRPNSTAPDVIDIVSDNFEVHETPATDGRVKLEIYFPYFYGSLDSALRFKAALHMAPGNGLIREGMNAHYALVLADKHWEFESDGRKTREVIGPLEWRIENTPSFATIGLATAIRYITEIRDKSTDPALKKNADLTLAKLKKLTAHAPVMSGQD